MAPATINRELAFLKRAYTVAIGDRLADSNPVKAIKLFRENNARVRFLSDDEEARLRKALGDAQWPLVAGSHYTRGFGALSSSTCGGKTSISSAACLTVPRSKQGEVRTSR